MSRFARRDRYGRGKTTPRRVEFLEPRLVLSWTAVSADPLPQFDPVPEFDAGTNDYLTTDITAEAAAGSLALAPLTAIPALNSLPGAAVSLYLDFDGHFESQWGSFSNVTTPVYDQDGDTSTFSDGELASIQRIWEHMAEDYAPFDVNVTTVDPGDFGNGEALRVSIGGNGSWTGGNYGGVAYVDSFTNSIANTVYVFSDNLGNGNAKYTAQASSHEAGHGFGLRHQSSYDADGNKVADYYQGPGDGRAPIMGNSYYATRGLWWYGTSTSATTYQDDMAVLARSTNGFGYRADDHGDSPVGATPLDVAGSQVSSTGIITTTADADYFSFQTDTGQITVSVDVHAGVNNLDASLALYDASGNLIASAAPTSSFGASITTSLSTGWYHVAVTSNGGYGDVGQYTVSGTIVPPADIDPVAAPSGLSATATSPTEVALDWTDNADNETFTSVVRSADGQNWTEIAVLAADVTAHVDTTVSPDTTYHYRVQAGSEQTVSGYSNEATATTPADPSAQPQAPTDLTATATSAGEVQLSWTDNADNETLYSVSRSTDGQNWSGIVTLGADATGYADKGVSADTTYHYRVQAGSAVATSDYSNEAVVTTPAVVVSPLPDAPTNLTATVTSATAASATQIDLAWIDQSDNEEGFVIERSVDSPKNWVTLVTVGPDATTYSDKDISAATSYRYRVHAFNIDGVSADSNVVKLRTSRLLKAAKSVVPSKGPLAVVSMEVSAAIGGVADVDWTSPVELPVAASQGTAVRETLFAHAAVSPSSQDRPATPEAAADVHADPFGAVIDNAARQRVAAKSGGHFSRPFDAALADDAWLESLGLVL